MHWAGVADTDEFFWAERASGIGDLLADTPADIVAVNFDMKLFLPTDLDVPDEPVFMARTHRSGSSDSPLHTSYRAGKTFYRADWLPFITNEHWCPEVPHPEYRHANRRSTTTWCRTRTSSCRRSRGSRRGCTRPRDGSPGGAGTASRRSSASSRSGSGPSKREWWGEYQRGGEAGVREYYRNVYTLVGDRRRAALADGSLVEDPGFSSWARDRYGTTP